MSTPTDRNRLTEAASPYLAAHADNPVNWQPWDEQARQTAREHDAPIFLSVGYAACHWCHVMAEESFEDPETAGVLNEHFVPVKVDREERPDVDNVYMSICQRVTGRGGWPLSVWLTPDGRPFYVGTYFPPEPKRGQPGFTQLLRDIHGSWTDPEQREDIEERADGWAAAIEDDLQDVPDQPSAPAEDALVTAADAARNAADPEYGGWGRGQKFPQPARVRLCLRAHERTGDDAYLAVATDALDAMAAGGLYDHLGGGFHRYTTDREWVVPHFEKMLYDNAELPRAFLAGYQLTGERRYATVAEETFAFLETELQHPDGGFYSTLDARSEAGKRGWHTGDPGERLEGAFYVWTPEEVRATVDEEADADLFCERYGVTSAGNFEGKTVLTETTPVSTLATDRGLDPTRVRERLNRAREQLRAARGRRPRPPRDEKVLAGWNGLAISAFAEGGLVVDDSYADTAVAALEFVREHLWDGGAGRLTRRYKDGQTRVDGYLADYAFLGRGALDCYQTTGEVAHLAFALELAAAIERLFWDADAGTLYFTPTDGAELVARPQEVTDTSTPSSAGVAASLLLAVDGFTDREYADVAERVVETHGNKIDADPLQHASLTLAADTLTEGHLELTLTADDPPADWRTTLAEEYVPRRLLAWRPAGASALDAAVDRLDAAEVPPLWAGRGPRDGRPAVYACRGFTCSPPRADVAGALGWARTQSGAGSASDRRSREE